ncbi:hypothetical protein GCM10009717_00330 [Agromyces allii]|uniref:Uncharacterized protein n=1 Tax=Agromyces allii TaxID=393607 RepID=A0ABP5B9Q9_9MICO
MCFLGYFKYMAAPLKARAENPEHRRPGPFTYGDYSRPDDAKPALWTHKPIRTTCAVSRTDVIRLPDAAEKPPCTDPCAVSAPGERRHPRRPIPLNRSGGLPSLHP